MCCYTAYMNKCEMPYWKMPRSTISCVTIINPASDFDPPIYDADYDLKICKKAPSIFFETGWANYFTKDRVDTAIITGCKHRWMHPCGRNRQL